MNTTRTPLTLPELGFGCATLGDPAQPLSETQAQATFQAAWDRGIRYFDTAPWYGNTKSEHRLGYFLRQQPVEDFIISTKVGRVYSRPADREAFKSSPWMKRWAGGLPFDLRFDYTRAGIFRSYEDSLQRLGLNRVDALVIHDLDPRHQRSEEGVLHGLHALDADGGHAALAELKRNGEIKAIGAGVNHVGMIPRFVERFDLDFFLVAMPYTLLDQSALDEELPLCLERNIDVIVGAPFASGILATGARPGALYDYKGASAQVLERVASMESVAKRHSVTLTAAALQFPLAHPAVVAVIPGPNSPEQVTANVEAFNAAIGPAFWADLKAEGLIREAAPVPGPA
ncbi:MAG: aldo/keto reductase [Gammaproteobacteria bacterium]